MVGVQTAGYVGRLDPILDGLDEPLAGSIRQRVSVVAPNNVWLRLVASAEEGAVRGEPRCPVGSQHATSAPALGGADEAVVGGEKPHGNSTRLTRNQEPIDARPIGRIRRSEIELPAA